MKWLITGGCGFIGSNLADALLGNGTDVVILDNLSRLGSSRNLDWLRSRYGTEWRFAEADIRDSEGLSSLIKVAKPDAIAHLAGQVAMTTSIQNPLMDFEVNALGTLNILEAVRLYSPTTIVLYSSTNKVYGSLDYLNYEETETRYILPDYPDGLDESLPLDGHSPYGCSKLAADQYVRDWHRMYDIPTIVFRHSSMYGGRQFATYNQGWIGWFCQKAIETREGLLEEPFTISGTGKQVRDILHVDDVIALYIKSIENIDEAKGNIFNIGGGIENSLSLMELFSFLEEYLGISMSYRKLSWRKGDQRVFVAHIEKARRLLGWWPKVNRVTGIGEMLQWVDTL